MEVVPRTREGILGYLSCGSLKGIGPKTAERIVNRFGLDTLEVMEKYPQELLKIQGISQKKPGPYCGFFWKKPKYSGN